MNRRQVAFQLIILGALMLFIIGAKAECPEYDPPFDATGEYEGEWWVGAGEHCPVSAEITMDPAAVPVPAWDPAAMFHVDFSCIELPPGFPPLDPADIQTIGLLGEDTGMIFSAFGCTFGLCLMFDSHGFGEDTDGDGMMDVYSGGWDYVFLVAGITPFGVTGEFELNRIEP